MILLNFDDYRDFIQYYLRNLPHHGRGELSKIAKHLRINSTWLSQILHGSKQFNTDQVIELGNYLELSDTEIEYFLLLVECERASTHKAKNYFKNKILILKRDASKLRNQVKFERSLTDVEKAIFYSSWCYSAVHLFTSTNSSGVTLEEVINEFKFKRPKAIQIMDFLLKSELCNKSGHKYISSTRSTYIDQTSPFLPKHHVNWRIKSIEKIDSIEEDELMFTAPVSLSKSDYDEIRKELVSMIRNISKKIEKSNPEILANLNIDWLRLKRNE